MFKGSALFLIGLASGVTFSCPLRAEISPVLFDFDAYANNVASSWVDGNGWDTQGSGGEFYVSNIGGFAGSNFIRFSDSGAGEGAMAAISNEFGRPESYEKFSLNFSYWNHNYWGTEVGLGNASRAGLRLTTLQYDAQTIRLALGNVDLGSGAYTFASEWTDVRLDIDLAANGNGGAASVYARPTGGGEAAWALVPGLGAIRLGLDAARTRIDSTNPLQWNTLWFHHEGADSGIDNVAVQSVPEPAATAALLGGALALIARRHRRK